MKTMIEMAREAGFSSVVGKHIAMDDDLERFAALVRADERNSWPAEMEAMERQVNILTDALAQKRERMKWDIHSCGPTCKKYACVAMREAVEAEREAHARVCEELGKDMTNMAQWSAYFCAAAIRARGSNT